MKILFFIESLRSGGKERRLVELIKGLSKYPDIEMELVLMKKDIHYRDIFSTGIKIHYTIRKHIKKAPLVFYKFYKIAKKFNPDTIHVWGSMVSIYAIPTKILLKIPMINNQITVAPLKVYSGLLSHRLSFPFSDKIVANSYAGLKSYNALKQKSSVIYNGFNFNRLKNIEKKSNVRKKLNIETKYVVGMVASFSELKDYKSYIYSANHLLNERKDITFLCIGAGDDEPYKKYVGVNNQKNILFLGKQSSIENLINICDIGVLMTNVKKHGEGISNALLEFSALGKPIIAVDNGGNPEIIENDKNGYLIKPYDYLSLAGKIKILLDNEQLKNQMGIKAKKNVSDKFSIVKMVDSFYEIYNKCMKKVN